MSLTSCDEALLTGDEASLLTGDEASSSTDGKMLLTCDEALSACDEDIVERQDSLEMLFLVAQFQIFAHGKGHFLERFFGVLFGKLL